LHFVEIAPASAGNRRLKIAVWNQSASVIDRRYRDATRQQGLDRFIVRHPLLGKIEAPKRVCVDAGRARLARIRRQKRRRSRPVRARMLADILHRADKKLLRRLVTAE